MIKSSYIKSILFMISMVLIFHSMYSCQAGLTIDKTIAEESAVEEAEESAIEEKVVPRLTDLNANTFKIVSVKDKNENITMASISFNTSMHSVVSLKIDDDEYTNEGTSHSFVVSVARDNLKYSITIDSDEEETFHVFGSIRTKYVCNMFSYIGEISAFMPVLLPVIKDIQENLGNHCEMLDIYFFGGVDYESIFNKELIFSLDERTPEEMFTSLNAQYLKHKEELMEAWPLISEDELMVVFVLNVVGRLWHFGNFIYPHASGCVSVNETITAEEGDYIFEYTNDGTPIYYKHPKDMSDYLNSEIGCCTDHAYITKLLLGEAGYITRRLVSPGHWFAEVLVDENWYTLDASFGVLVKSSIEDMAVTDERTAYIFILPYMEEKHPLIYPNYTKYTISLGLELPVTDEYVYIYR